MNTSCGNPRLNLSVIGLHLRLVLGIDDQTVLLRCSPFRVICLFIHYILAWPEYIVAFIWPSIIYLN